MNKLVTVRLDAQGLDDALIRLGQKASLAKMRALNRTIKTAETYARRALAQDTGLPSSVAGKALAVTKATVTRPDEAILEATGARLTLYVYTRQRKVKGVPTGRGRKPGAFIARVKAGHRGDVHYGIFKRKGKSRSRKGLKSPSPGLPIVELRGPSLPHVFTSAAIMDGLVRAAEEALVKNLRHEIQFLESKLTA